MSRMVYFFLFLLFSFFSVKFFETSCRDYNIIEKGESKLAKIISIGNCGRSGGTIKVQINDIAYSLGIGKNDCIKAKYNIGDEIEVIYGKEYDFILLPNSNVAIGIYMSLVFFLIPIYCLMKLLKK